jgi:hypothetical protein
LAIPLAGLAARRVWAALVLGGSLAVLTVVLVPPTFTVLSDAVSLAQARRLLLFLPVAFAVAGGCIVLSRLKAVGVGLAGGASLALVILYPGEYTRRYEEGGPAWAVWVAVAGGLAAIAAGVLLRSRGPSPSVWSVAAAVAFAGPVALAGLSGLTQDGPTTKLTSEIVESIRAEASSGDVVFSDIVGAYEIAAFAPVYVNAALPGHVADIPRNREAARAASARRFFAVGSLTDRERRGILDRYGADWVLVDKDLPHPELFLQKLDLVYDDERFAFYKAPP